jgi:hypothetical protein
MHTGLDYPAEVLEVRFTDPVVDQEHIFESQLVRLGWP